MDEHSWSGDCGEAIHRLYHFLDGELTPERRSEIRRHLDACEPCLEAFDFELELRQVIATRCRDRVPEHLRSRIAAAILHEQAQGGSDLQPEGSEG
ncbi:MAG TPA: mycothiol system anti-sigma-R factor [Acidimicrobiales bacterium]|jgi:anti-sigma factor (TIGR02949 family)|nr:mycothiol system anti-sigma-R factor [Acidimicrobiales bacterium]